MSHSREQQRAVEAHKRWLGYLQPDGLVVSAAALVDKGHYYNEAQRERQLEFIDHLAAFQKYDEEEGTVEIIDFKALATDFLGLPGQEWVDAADMGDTCTIPLKESSETLAPTAALRWPRGMRDGETLRQGDNGKEKTAEGNSNSPSPKVPPSQSPSPPRGMRDGETLRQGDNGTKESAEGGTSTSPSLKAPLLPKSFFQLLIREHPAEIDGKPIDFDTDYEVIANTWSTSATRRMERLLRETEIPIGLLVSPTHLRLVYAPVGENAGSITFHFADMLSTMGRPILGAFDLLFNIEMLFIGEESHQLPALLRHSRDMQANVSIELARQVLDGLYDLVRGTQAADARTNGKLLRHILATNPNLIYEGQLNVLLRLVFLLFAEDRGLMPNSELYNQHYSVHALYERLRQDAALHHDTMDDRYGAWAQLLALFRLIFHGHRHRDFQLPARHGYLFDPDRFPFLEGKSGDFETMGRGDFENESAAEGSASNSQSPKVSPSQSPSSQSPSGEAAIPLISDGTIFRLLQGLLFLNGERISYRTLDVEQIGSVYETMMGFALALADGQTIAIRPQKKHGAAVNLNLDHLLALKGAARHKVFVEETGRKLTGKRLTEFNSAATTDELLAVLQGPAANSSIIARNATPHLAQPGALLLQPTDARRKSGSHYTARKLTEPIVRKALAPILAAFGDKPFPSQILGLKICDPAVGSGAFLVEVCRQLAEALVKAWAAHGGKPVIPPDEDEVLHARRLVAQRCLYGVDRNPMAVDLAKLSLWLTTLAKEHPFTFLDHSIRSGDSLVGLSKNQILSFHWDLEHESAKQRVFGQDQLEKRIKSALAYRQEILDAGDYVLPEMKAAQLRLAEDEVDKVRRAGDLAVLGFFSGSKKGERQEARDRLLERWLKATDGSGSEDSLREGILLKKEIRQAQDAEKPVAPFHWEVEFPEVFERPNPGFDTFVGNPPYAGKNTYSESNAPCFTKWLQTLHVDSHGNADLAAHFFRRAYTTSRNGGTVGFVTTNTIAQGDTRTTGLRWIGANGGAIYLANRRMRWPGEAAVVVSVVILQKGEFKGNRLLDNTVVSQITAFLFHAGTHENPAVLEANGKIAFKGAETGSLQYLIGETDALHTNHRDTMRSDGTPLVKHYLTGSDFNATPDHLPSRFVLDVDGLPDAEFSRLSDVDEYLKSHLRPDLLSRREITPETKEWWHFRRPSERARSAITSGMRMLGISRVSDTGAFAFIPDSCLPNSDVICVIDSEFGFFCLLQSCIHDTWMRFFGSSMKDDLRYAPSDCFETFPLPENWDTNARLEEIGREYYDYRADLMVRNDEGLTKTYNRFHDPGETSPDIHQLRSLHAAMDRAVLDAYGWTDVPTDCEFIPDFTEEDDDGNEIPKNIRYRWPDEVRDDVLARLLALNAERYQQEVNAGLHTKGKGAKKKPTKVTTKKPKKKTAKTKPQIIDIAPQLGFVAEMDQPVWIQKVSKFQYALPDLPRTKAPAPLAYYRALIPALVQTAGGSLPITRVFDAVARLSDSSDLSKDLNAVPETLLKTWTKRFNEELNPDAFGTALADLVQNGDIVRLVGSQEDLELRLVKENSITVEWYLLDAEIALTAEAAVFARDEETSLPEALLENIIEFVQSA